MTPQFSTNPIGATIQSCPLKEPKLTHWISIELVGEDGKGIAFEEFCITLPDGSRRTGMLDEKGRARLDNLPDAGVGSITFPELDTDAWKFLESEGA